jgi:hypothetical protein
MPTSEIRRTVELPCGYTAVFQWPCEGGAWLVTWEPEPPIVRRRRPMRKFMDAYRTARRDFLTEVAAVTGQSMAVVDLDGVNEVIQPPSKQ